MAPTYPFYRRDEQAGVPVYKFYKSEDDNEQEPSFVSPVTPGVDDMVKRLQEMPKNPGDRYAQMGLPPLKPPTDPLPDPPPEPTNPATPPPKVTPDPPPGQQADPFDWNKRRFEESSAASNASSSSTSTGIVEQQRFLTKDAEDSFKQAQRAAAEKDKASAEYRAWQRYHEDQARQLEYTKRNRELEYDEKEVALEKQRRAALEEREKETEVFRQRLKNPQDFWGSKSTADQIVLSIAVALGTLGTRPGQENQGVKVLNDALNRHQEFLQDSYRKTLEKRGRTKETFDEMQSRLMAERRQALQQVQYQVADQIARSLNPVERKAFWDYTLNDIFDTPLQGQVKKDVVERKFTNPVDERRADAIEGYVAYMTKKGALPVDPKYDPTRTQDKFHRKNPFPLPDVGGRDIDYAQQPGVYGERGGEGAGRSAPPDIPQNESAGDAFERKVEQMKATERAKYENEWGVPMNAKQEQQLDDYIRKYLRGGTTPDGRSKTTPDPEPTAPDPLEDGIKSGRSGGVKAALGKFASTDIDGVSYLNPPGAEATITDSDKIGDAAALEALRQYNISRQEGVNVNLTPAQFQAAYRAAQSYMRSKGAGKQPPPPPPPRPAHPDDVPPPPPPPPPPASPQGVAPAQPQKMDYEAEVRKQRKQDLGELEAAARRAPANKADSEFERRVKSGADDLEEDLRKRNKLKGTLTPEARAKLEENVRNALKKGVPLAPPPAPKGGAAKPQPKASGTDFEAEAEKQRKAELPELQKAAKEAKILTDAEINAEAERKVSAMEKENKEKFESKVRGTFLARERQRLRDGRRILLEAREKKKSGGK